MNDPNTFSDINKKVSVYINGKHGRIGIIVPDTKPTEQEWVSFNEEIADLIYNHKIRPNT